MLTYGVIQRNGTRAFSRLMVCLSKETRIASEKLFAFSLAFHKMGFRGGWPVPREQLRDQIDRYKHTYSTAS
jgi:hypothetical protein